VCRFCVAVLSTLESLSSHSDYRRFVAFSFFFNATPTTEIYTLSLHDALPIFALGKRPCRGSLVDPRASGQHEVRLRGRHAIAERSEEHTSELQSRVDLVCRLLLEKKKKQVRTKIIQELRTGTHG